jgi:L-ascorbate metabolism protein UlaG (beta-lactamase superfamily)
VIAAALALSIMTTVEPGFRQPRDEEGRFVNLEGPTPAGFLDFLRWRWERIGNGRPDGSPAPRVEPDLARIARPPGPGEGARITWIGHASFLVQLDGVSLLVDPVLSESIGPGGVVSRKVAPGLSLEQLPHVDAVLVSHDHYDHLDVPTLARVRAPVLAGLGMERIFQREKLLYAPMRWWQSLPVGGLTVTFVPSRHFSGRGLGDRNKTLWGGFVIQGPSATLYHAGDSAYFSGFAEIGRRFPGVDAAMLPIGAYDPAWFMERVHMNPEQALQAFEDLGAHTFVAMHWGTFRQTDEPLDEPPGRVEAERARRGWAPERVRVLSVGETLEVRRLPEAAAAAAGGASPTGASAGADR